MENLEKVSEELLEDILYVIESVAIILGNEELTDRFLKTIENPINYIDTFSDVKIHSEMQKGDHVFIYRPGYTHHGI